MKTFQDNVIIVENGASVLSDASNFLISSMIRAEDFLEFTGNVNGTVELEAAEMPVPGEKAKLLKELFGSWIENGDEDKQLDELYQSRLTLSSSPVE